MAQDSRNMDFFSALLVGYFDFCLQILPPCEVEHAKPLASLPFESAWVIIKISLDSFYPPIASCLSFDKEFISNDLNIF